MEISLTGKERKLVLEGKIDEYFNLSIQKTKPCKDTECVLNDKKKSNAYHKRYNGKSKED